MILKSFEMRLLRVLVELRYWWATKSVNRYMVDCLHDYMVDRPMRPKRRGSSLVASSRASSHSNNGQRALNCVLINSSSHLVLTRPRILLVAMCLTQPEVDRYAWSATRSATATGFRGSSDLNNPLRVLIFVLIDSWSNLAIVEPLNLFIDTW